MVEQSFYRLGIDGKDADLFRGNGLSCRGNLSRR